IGVAGAGAGSLACHNSRPVSVSKARQVLSSVAPMKVKPLAVVSGPPRVGVPHLTARGSGARSRRVPRGTCQRSRPVLASTAARVPHGGALHGMFQGESRARRRITYGVPFIGAYSQPPSTKPSVALLLFKRRA